MAREEKTGGFCVRRGNQNEEETAVRRYRMRWYEGLANGRYASGTDFVEARTKEEARARWQRTRDQDSKNARRVCLSVEVA